MTDKRLVSVYRSPKKTELYLYIDRKTDLSSLPEALLEQFGKPVLVTHLLLSAERRMARVKAADVLKGVEEKGFFLQLPPPPDAEALKVITAREMHPTAGGRIDRDGD